MPIKAGDCLLAVLFTCVFAALLCQAQEGDSKVPWKGYAILGNGHLTAVYSDDDRIQQQTHAEGIQHLYFNDYTADYLASTSFRVSGAGPAGNSSPGMKNFFTCLLYTSWSLDADYDGHSQDLLDAMYSATLGGKAPLAH